jgi:hypothetical protein
LDLSSFEPPPQAPTTSAASTTDAIAARLILSPFDHPSG